MSEQHPRLRTLPRTPGIPVEINGVTIPVTNWTMEPRGHDLAEATLQVNMTFNAEFVTDPEPETPEQQAERIKAEQEAALTAAVDHWAGYCEGYYSGMPLVLAALDLHRPIEGCQRVDCGHCEQSDGMEATENAPWPCATYTALTNVRHLTDSRESTCGLADMGEPVDIDVPVGGVSSGYTVSFTPDEIRPIRAAASAAGKTTSAYLHDLAAEASSPVTANVTVQGPVTTEQDIARAIEKHLLRRGMGGPTAYRR